MSGVATSVVLGASLAVVGAQPISRRWPVTRSDVSFASGADRCAAWLYRPGAARGPRPVVVLGHGLGCVKEMRLDAFAEAFAAAGYVALAFDYRYFGASTGSPRQLLDIPDQLADWRAAVACARSLPGVDPSQVVLFGTSFSGGHVLEIARADSRIAAVISQCPFTSGPASTLTLGVAAPGAGLLGIEDLAAAARGEKPVMIRLAARPGQVALLNAPDVLAGYYSLVPPGLRFVNAVAARVATQIPLYSPGEAAAGVRAPVLFGVCDRDSVAPPGPTLAYARTAPRASVMRYPVRHFDIYLGDPFRRAVSDYLRFLQRWVPAPVT